MRVGVYAGSFDPFTKGHLSVLRGAVKAFDHVVVGIGVNSEKKGFFNRWEREEIIKEYIQEEAFHAVTFQTFNGLLVDFCVSILNTPLPGRDAPVIPDTVSIVRGLRAVSDLETEMSIADANRRLNPRFQTLFIPTEADLAFVSSSILKEIARNKVSAEKLDPYVIRSVGARVQARIRELG